MADYASAQVRLLCLDVDGVLTDGGIYFNGQRIEAKRFHVRDGTGIRAWIRLGYQVAIITGRKGIVVDHRAKELGIEHVIQGSRDKGEALHDLQQLLGVSDAQTAVMGDDLPDLPMMRLCAYPIAVADAVDEVKNIAKFVTKHGGGHGAVREAIEHMIKARNQWHQVLTHFGETADE